MNLLDRLLGHDQWTTDFLLTQCAALTDAQLDQEFDIGFRTLRMTFAHMIGGVEFWTSAMEGRPEEMREQPRSIAELQTAHAASYAAFAAAARRLTKENRLDEQFYDWYGWPKSFGAVIVNVPLHNERHRGDVFHMLQRLGFDQQRDGDPGEWEYATGQVEARPRDEDQTVTDSTR